MTEETLKLAVQYWAYSGDTTPEEVRRLFQERHGYEPEIVKRSGTIWLAGPVEVKFLLFDWKGKA